MNFEEENEVSLEENEADYELLGLRSYNIEEILKNDAPEVKIIYKSNFKKVFPGNNQHITGASIRGVKNGLNSEPCIISPISSGQMIFRLKIFHFLIFTTQI